ncbi:MAG: hypothetical protein AAF485_17650 [Chloroflexota bacterium]
MTNPVWQEILQSIIETEAYEITCHECYDALDQYADLLIEGADPDEILPLVKQHLGHCPDCTTLFDTLLTMVKASGIDSQLISEAKS